MAKIAIVGSPGAGKSTLSRELGVRLNKDRLGPEVIHLDKFFWHEGWQETPKDAWKEFQKYLINLPQWIIDGTYLSTSDIRIQAADTIIFLDRSRLLCLLRVIWRHFQYADKPRPDFSDECLDKLDWNYIKKVWSFPEVDRPTLLENIQKYDKGKAYFRLHSQREINHFLQSYPAQQPPFTKGELHQTIFQRVAATAGVFLSRLWDNLSAANLPLPIAGAHSIAPWDHFNS